MNRYDYDYHAKVRADLRTSRKGMAQPSENYRLFNEFFKAKSRSAAKRYWIKFRQYAHFNQLTRAEWPVAFSRLLEMDRDRGRAEIRNFKYWLRNTYRGYSGSGADAAGIDSFMRFARERGAIAWRIPNLAQDRAELAWEDCTLEFRKLIEEWLLSLVNRNFSKHSLVKLKSNLREFGGFLKARNLDYRGVDYAHANEWLGSLFKKGWAAASVRSYLGSVKSFYRWLRIRRLITQDPICDLGPVRVEAKLPDSLSEEEMLLVIGGARTVRDRALIELFYATGARAGEVEGIRITRLDISERTIKCMGKGKRERILHFNEATAKAIRSYLPVRARLLRRVGRAGEEALFVNISGRPLTFEQMRRAVREMGIRAGLKKPIHPHLIRHSFATHLLNHDADPFTLMRLLGHKSIQATAVYIQIAVGRIAEVYRRCHPRK